jgi:hypothetical protein
MGGRTLYIVAIAFGIVLPLSAVLIILITFP